MYGPLHYLQLIKQNDKIIPLKNVEGDYDAHVTLQIQLNNILTGESKTLIVPRIQSVAFHLGSRCCVSHKIKLTRGRLTQEEMHQHISVLQMKAAVFSLQTFCNDIRDQHVGIRIDNTTIIGYINNMSRLEKMGFNSLKEPSDLELLSCQALVTADRASRVFYDHTQWKLDENIFFSVTS